MKKLKISTDVYSIGNIHKTMDVYKGYANIDIQVENNRITLNFNNCIYDEDTTIKEFENYLIGVENS